MDTNRKDRFKSSSTHILLGIVVLSFPACHIPAQRLAIPGPTLPTVFPTTANKTSELGETPQSLPTVQNFYTDPKLLKLIEQAVAGNQELKMLNEEVQIAVNEVQARRGAIFPTIGLGAVGGFDRNSAFMPLGAAERQLTYPTNREFPDPVPRVGIGAFLNWQVDIWRELRNARDAAIARLAAATERRNAFINQLVADVADNYYQLLALDNRIVVLDQTIALQEESLKVAIARKEAGRETELAVQRFQAEVRRNQSEKLVVRQEQVEVENRINFLLGRYPVTIERTPGDFTEVTLAPPEAGLPAQLLQSRPDIRQAERELTAAGLDVLVARARFFPRLDITAGLGWEAFNPRYLFDPGAFVANAAGGLIVPFVNRAAIKADYQSANARQLQAVYNYQRVVLDAFTEVVTQLNAAENFKKSVELRKQQLEAQAASVDSATKLFLAARVEYIEVLFAQRDLLNARLELIETKRRQISAAIAAYRALGGGPAVVATQSRP
jgi:NodT family efflux transporter outer membrane factor (OMF) lipoprotein